MIRLRNKAFISGFGTGFIILSIVFYIASFTLKNVPPPSEGSNALPAIAELTNEEILEKAKALGLIEPSQDVKQAPIVQYETLSDAELILKAATLGMIFPEENQPPEMPEIDEVTEVSSLPPEIEFVTLRIMGGWPAIRICRFLEENGVIDNAEAFQNYVIAQARTHSLNAGTFTFPLRTNYDEVIRVLTKQVVYP